MELRQLLYFVTVADELNFSKAAVRLHMSQPPLSQQIKALEDEIGVELLTRNRREVRLTDAGRAFQSDCRSVLEQVRVAVSTARRTAAGDIGTLQIGMVTSGIYHVLPTILKRMAESFPGLHIAVTDMGSADQVHAVMQGKLDVGVVHSVPTRAGLGKAPIFTEHFSIVVPEGHEFTTKSDLTIRDLEEMPLVAFSRDHAPALFDAMIASCLDAGFSPTIAHTARNPLTTFQMVRLGLGVALVPRSYARAGMPGVVFREIGETAGHIQLYAIWREQGPGELVRKVLGTVMREPIVS
ncbi:LysR family transcriptional regulator [Cupriavidus basilensis]|nr:LysR family transcriptional regulator [Cupriavidus basilensis]